MIGGAPQSYHDEIRRKEMREQRRYEIARDVMAATRAASWISTRQTPDQPEVLASWAIADADALLAALEETER